MRIAPSGTDVRFIENNNKDDEGKDYPQVEEGQELPISYGMRQGFVRCKAVL